LLTLTGLPIFVAFAVAVMQFLNGLSTAYNVAAAPLLKHASFASFA